MTQKKDLYGDLPRITDKIRERRLRFAGHYCRFKEEPVSRILNLNPTHGKRKPGRPNLTYIDFLKQGHGT